MAFLALGMRSSAAQLRIAFRCGARPFPTFILSRALHTTIPCSSIPRTPSGTPRDPLRPSAIRTPTRSRWSRVWTRAWWWSRAKGTLFFCAVVFNVFCFLHLVTVHLFRITIASGPSMLPTFATEGEVFLEDRLSYRHFDKSLVRGDIVVVESPLSRGRYVCKRVIGLPGDIICVDPTGEYAPSTEHVVIPKGHIWLMGDNAAYSRDSRTYGPVPMGLVKGRIVARIWPFHKFTTFPSGSGVNYLT